MFKCQLLVGILTFICMIKSSESLKAQKSVFLVI